MNELKVRTGKRTENCPFGKIVETSLFRERPARD